MAIPLQPCESTQLPLASSVPVGTTCSLIDQGGATVYSNGVEWLAYEPGVPLTQLVGDVSTLLGGGIQEAIINARTSDPDSPTEDRLWFLLEGTSPYATLSVCLRHDGTTVKAPLFSL